jgi:hypothetical protein
MHDYKIIDEQIICGDTDEMRIAGHLAAMAKKHSCLDVGGDSIGLGSGIFARLEELGEYRVHRINSARSSTNTGFLNLRAQMYWHMMQRVIDKDVAYPECEELRRQLINITYEITGSNGQIKITSKDKIKKIISRSPDRADCFAMACWLMDKVDPWTPRTRRDAYAFDDTYDYDFNGMTA